MSKASHWHGRARYAALALALLAGGCNTDRMVTGSTYPYDYRDRHPIRLTEGIRSLQLLIGSGRGELTIDQRAQVTALAGAWRREGTGLIVMDLPRGSRNERAAKYAAREAQSVLQAAGVPSRSIRMRNYQPPQAEDLGPLRIAYTRIEAAAGPCGEWPEDLGANPRPSVASLPHTIDNRAHWNFGCATQRNLAAAVVNPEDLVQPRAETPPFAARRATVIDKYRQGQDTATVYTEVGDAQVSNVGE